MAQRFWHDLGALAAALFVRRRSVRRKQVGSEDARGTQGSSWGKMVTVTIKRNGLTVLLDKGKVTITLFQGQIHRNQSNSVTRSMH